MSQDKDLNCTTAEQREVLREALTNAVNAYTTEIAASTNKEERNALRRKADLCWELHWEFRN